jgi:hypothetical protein
VIERSAVNGRSDRNEIIIGCMVYAALVAQDYLSP